MAIRETTHGELAAASHGGVPTSGTQSDWLYAFGGFRFDPFRGVLSYGAEVIPLPARLGALLLALIQGNGSLVPREALIQAMSPDFGASQANLSQHIYMLRRILGEKARDRLYITTAHSRGFRFVAPVTIVRPTTNDLAPDGAESAPRRGLLDCGVAAFRHYIQGAYLLERRTAPTLRLAIKSFEAALAINSNYVPALIGIGRAYALLAEYVYVPASHAFPKAKEAIIRALKIDSGSAEAHSALSNLFLFCDWEWREARREIDIAVRLNPDSVAVCTNASWYYNCSGAPDRALAQAQHGLQIEPASPALHILLGSALTACGDLQEAAGYFSGIAETGPDVGVALRHRAQALILSEEPDEAIVDLLSLPQDPAEDVSIRLPLLGRAYADSGDTERASEIYEALIDMSKTVYVTQRNLAIVATGLGHYDKALEHLETAVARREPNLVLRSSAWFAPIVKTDKYKELVRLVGP